MAATVIKKINPQGGFNRKQKTKNPLCGVSHPLRAVFTDIQLNRGRFIFPDSWPILQLSMNGSKTRNT